jgi:hypothetical protein
MRKILFIALIALICTSCLKSANRNLGPDPDGYIRYQVNSMQLEYSGGYDAISSTGVGVYATKQIETSSANRYTITGQLGNNKTIKIVIVTDSLQRGPYTTASTAGTTLAYVDSAQFTNNRPVDYLTVSISRVSNGTIDGTFSGRLSNSKTIDGVTTYSDGLVTDGLFQNVAIHY